MGLLCLIYKNYIGKLFIFFYLFLKENLQFISQKHFIGLCMSLPETRVVIIGAGVSAIGAARTLRDAGVKPILLEARNRIGGRLLAHELTQNLSNDGSKSDARVTVQLGANWIHGLDAVMNPLFKLAQKLDLKLHQTSPDDEPGDDVLLFDTCQTQRVPFVP